MMGFKKIFSQLEARDLPKGQLNRQLIACRTPDLTAALKDLGPPPMSFHAEGGKEEGSTYGQARRGENLKNS